MSLQRLLIIGFLLIISQSLYTQTTPVIQLTSKDFSQTQKGIWLVQFYAPWCGHCKNLAPQYEKAAKGLKGIANIAAIDASNQKVNVQVQGYPTIKLFVDGKSSDYNGDRTAGAIIDFMLKEFRQIAMKRIGSGSSNKESGHSQGETHGEHDEKDVVILTADNFDQIVYGDKNAWFIEFYAPWCGHCTRLAPEWASLATQLKGQVKVAKIDATQAQQIASRFGVRGYPTIKFFKPGQKDDSLAIDYQGGRTQQQLAEWARGQLSDLKIFQHTQLTSQSVYDQQCKGRNLCIINFLPSVIDSTQEERRNYFNTIREVGLRFKGKPFKFLWSQGGDQLELQDKLGVSGIGYPSVVAVFQTKQVYGRLKRSFSEENLENFLSDIMKNKAKFAKLSPLPTLKDVKKIDYVNEVEENGNNEKNEEGCDEHQCTEPSDDESVEEQYEQL